ncbi:site-specific integrase [Burkholderia cenocepacia]|uniref:site-specific integrase n=1 Tax=Burkholderia cenocepacia TaxID=95486 RepID=UPI002B25400E|nr:site-specific integrase [Burkholderia cenocepacia]MEB2600057.1 site-specific integrase [Burkholderia cenocepacia]
MDYEAFFEADAFSGAAVPDVYLRTMRERTSWSSKPSRSCSKATRSSFEKLFDILPSIRLTESSYALFARLRLQLTEAVEDELITRNVLQNWTYQRNDEPTADDDVDPFTPDEQRAVLDALTGQERNLFQFAFWTGLRTSEIIALQWTDVDWSRGTIRVQRAQTRAARVLNKVEKTKTRASRRDVKLLGPALAALTDQKRFTLLLGGVIFMNPRTGAAWSGDNVIWLAWGRAIQKSKVRYRRPYQTRHTYASMLLSAGEPPMWVANQMGHISLKMLEQRYGRWIKDAAPDAGRLAEALFAAPVMDARAAGSE